jgi:hypothetical protein
MTESTTSSDSASPEGAPVAAARVLPSREEIAAWAQGTDLPSLGALFSELPVAKFDALVMQIRKEELLPQHWQVIGDRTLPDATVFESYPEIARLQAVATDSETAGRQVAALRTAWQELAGKQPALWTTSDLFVALRRSIERDLPVDYNDLLTATREVWRGLTLPHGRAQLETLWACLDLIRQKTKK